MRNVFNFLFLSQSASKVSCVLLTWLPPPGRARWTMPGHAHSEVMLVQSSWYSCLALSRTWLTSAAKMFCRDVDRCWTQGKLPLPISALKYQGINRSATWHPERRSPPSPGFNDYPEERARMSCSERAAGNLGIIWVFRARELRKFRKYACAPGCIVLGSLNS